ncbi:hypothetical protein F0562_010262 [Nyssa sinensis]|uniref:Uncharacterized protein n=1 Tax=Nyssa sinensis TaxID=561372 RepID=A0A5J5A0L2_9ASTE|nr:hypothetical protein F0562_010262 [Nyssa sinensis]
MGIWDFINPTTDALKRNAPDLTPVKDACLSSYSYSRTAVTKVNNAVMDKFIHGLNQHLPDDEGRDKIGRFSKNLAKNAADYAWHEGLKCVPGGDAIHKIVSRTVRDEMAFQAKMGTPEKESSGFGKTFEQAEIRKCNVELGSGNAVLDSNANKKPEDLIRIFMMKEYIGNQILCDLIIREGRRGTNWK